MSTILFSACPSLQALVYTAEACSFGLQMPLVLVCLVRFYFLPQQNLNAARRMQALQAVVFLDWNQ